MGNNGTVRTIQPSTFPRYTDPDAVAQLRQLLQTHEMQEPLSRAELLMLFDEKCIVQVGTVKTLVSFGIAPIGNTMAGDGIECLVRYDFRADGTCCLVPHHGLVTEFPDWFEGYRCLLKSEEDTCSECARFYARAANGFTRLRQELDDDDGRRPARRVLC